MARCCANKAAGIDNSNDKENDNNNNDNNNNNVNYVYVCMYVYVYIYIYIYMYQVPNKNVNINNCCFTSIYVFLAKALSLYILSGSCLWCNPHFYQQDVFALLGNHDHIIPERTS